jgi:hypothetical protein
MGTAHAGFSISRDIVQEIRKPSLDLTIWFELATWEWVFITASD